MRRKIVRASCFLMGALYVVAGLNHFVNEAFYVSIMPPYVPWHRPMVWISGVIEIGLGIAVFFPRTRSLAGWGLVAMLIAIFPANLHMALAEPGTYDAPGWGLWLRLPVQGLLIAWAIGCTRPERDAEP